MNPLEHLDLVLIGVDARATVQRFASWQRRAVIQSIDDAIAIGVSLQGQPLFSAGPFSSGTVVDRSNQSVAIWIVGRFLKLSIASYSRVLPGTHTADKK